MTNQTDTTSDELFAAALSLRKARWCRARLLHALAGAAEQDVLADVLDELIGDDLGTYDALVTALVSTGWLKRDPRVACADPIADAEAP